MRLLRRLAVSSHSLDPVLDETRLQRPHTASIILSSKSFDILANSLDVPWKHNFFSITLRQSLRALHLLKHCRLCATYILIRCIFAVLPTTCTRPKKWRTNDGHSRTKIHFHFTSHKIIHEPRKGYQTVTSIEFLFTTAHHGDINPHCAQKQHTGPVSYFSYAELSNEKSSYWHQNV